MSDRKSLEILNLRKSFGAATVLSDISMSAGRGEFISLVGPSGCGKTTTLNIVAGFEAPDAGDVRIDGESMLGTPSYRRKLGMVFQSHALFPHMTIAENVGFGLAMQRVPKPEVAQRVAAVLDMVKLTALADRYPRQLSGGQQQRVGIARALTVRPKVLLMDEPLSSLDAKLRREMQTEIRRIQQEVGITTLYVTHDQEEALTMSDCIVLMNRGHIEQAGHPEELYKAPASLFAASFIGESSFLDASVEALSGDAALVRIDPATRVEIARAAWMQPKARLQLAVRPQGVGIRPAGAGEGSIEGAVVSRAFVGSVIRYIVALPGGQEVQAQPSAQQDFLPEIGDRVGLSIERPRWMAFPPETAS